jgi:hypothetical protein
MKTQTFVKAGVLLKYCLPAHIGGRWMAPLALALFIGGYIWRKYLNGQHDAVFFEVLSLGALWYVYCAGFIKTLCGLRVNSNSFLIDDFKKISYWLGLCSSVLIYCCTFLFLNQFGSAGTFIFLIFFQPGYVLLVGRRWHKWIDVARLNVAGIIPFLLINAYLMMTKVFPVSIGWLIFSSFTFVLFLLGIFYSQYKAWMNNPRNSSFLDVDYRHVKKYYRSNRGFD